MRYTQSWNGQVGIITKVPTTPHGAWAILLSSGELIATTLSHRMKVLHYLFDGGEQHESR